MKKIYICGDSFGCPNIGWTFDPWPTLLAAQLGSAYTVTNLSISCASNLLIRMQVDRAIASQADFIILLGTACTRSQGQVRKVNQPNTGIYDRFVRIGDQNDNVTTRDLACYSIQSLNETCAFDQDDIASIKDYQSRLFNLDLAIYENQCIIESSLHQLKEHNIPFIFDQGGFENPIFGDVRQTDYFSNFNKHKSDINQWTLSSYAPKTNMTHFHIIDPNIHAQIADYYKIIIEKFLLTTLPT
jgi:hypothetical protein